MYCKYCGEKLFEGQTVCVKCGKAINEQPKEFVATKESTSEKNVRIKKPGNLNGHRKTTMVLLCLLLGAYGAHNFVMGENKKGIVKVIASLCGVGFILAIIDLVKLISNTYVCNPDAFI